MFDILSTSSDSLLGGEDFNILIKDYLIKKFKKKTGIYGNLDKKAIDNLEQEIEMYVIKLLVTPLGLFFLLIIFLHF